MKILLLSWIFANGTTHALTVGEPDNRTFDLTRSTANKSSTKPTLKLKPKQESNPKPTNNLLMSTPPGTWVEIPNSQFKDILPPESFKPPIRYIVGPAAIMSAWNGAVFNTHLQRLDIFASGGHGDYCGNEYGSFDLSTLKWTLIHGPSDLTGFNLKTGVLESYVPPPVLPRNALNPGMGVAADGKPISRHTYAGQVYHPGLGISFMFGGSLCSGSGTADDRWWKVTPDGQYELLGGVGAWASLGWSAAYDPSSENIFLSLGGNIFEYDVRRNKKSRLTNFGDSGRWGQSVAIDSSRNMLFRFGHYDKSIPHTRAFKFNTVTRKHEYIDLTGDLSIANFPGVGLEYVPKLDRYAAWHNGGILYLIEPTTFHITAYQTKGTPPPDSTNGVYGRFSYSAVYGGFVVVTRYDANVFFLKLPAQ